MAQLCDRGSALRVSSSCTLRSKDSTTWSFSV